MNKWFSCVRLRGEGSNRLPDYRDLPGVSFRWEDLIYGTRHFQRSNIIGQGNFGNVYRCNLPGINQEGAAKIQKDVVHEDVRREFVTEIQTLHDADHPNVIKLLGKCIETDRSVIIYEYMPKGSLDHHLYARENNQNPALDWETRMKIAVGVAEALVYLHQRLKVIHLDLKDSNVLLNDDFVPKLTDFGIATKVKEDKRGVEKQKEIYPIKGTKGFIAPETKQHGMVSTKSDVYGYGVFLLTLFTGKKAYDLQRPRGKMNIADWFNPAWSKREFQRMAIDSDMANRYSSGGSERLFEIVKECLKPQANERPPMRYVEEMVRSAASLPVQPIPMESGSIDDDAIP